MDIYFLDFLSCSCSAADRHENARSVYTRRLKSKKYCFHFFIIYKKLSYIKIQFWCCKTCFLKFLSCSQSAADRCVNARLVQGDLNLGDTPLFLYAFLYDLECSHLTIVLIVDFFHIHLCYTRKVHNIIQKTRPFLLFCLVWFVFLKGCPLKSTFSNVKYIFAL